MSEMRSDDRAWVEAVHQPEPLLVTLGPRTLELAGAEPDRTILIESLEPQGAYRTSTLNSGQAADRDTLLALSLDGETLALDHGFPCRLIAPNRPGVLQTKWVNRVVVL